MSTAGNTLDHFPAESFTIQELAKALRCSRCNSRAASLRIVYTGAGGFYQSG